MANNFLRFWQSLDGDDPMDALFAAAPILMHSIDADGVLLNVSRFWADKLGYSVEEMIGQRSTEFLSPESRDYAQKVVLPKFFRTGQITSVPYDFVRKDKKVLPVLMSAIAERNADGAFVRSLAVMFDNTEAKRQAAELQRQQRLDAIGSLVGGVAHDFNNLLAIIQGNLEFLGRDPDSPDRLDFLSSALEATRRGASLTQHLLSYGRRAHLSPTLVDINDVVVASDRLVRRLFPSNISFEAVTAGGLWHVSVDVAQLETAVLNILNNARDALPDGGRITLETRNVRIDDGYVADRTEVIEPGRYVMLAISDSGTGMEDDTLAKAFEPFFTTKPVGKGSGLGLSMVFGFMRQSSGTIRAYSEVGVGTTFKLYFPAVTSGAPDAPGEDPAELVRPGAGRVILVAEDQDEVRSVLARQLLAEGLQVVECASGDAAMRRIETGLEPDLLLTDIVMPGALQGPELAQRARDRLPGLKVLFISGYPTEAAIHGKGVSDQDRQLIKPVSRQELIKTVMDLLDGA